MDIFAIICSDGALTSRADIAQCQNEKWIPIAVINDGGKITVILFYDLQVAMKFIKRNFSKDWTRGIINLSDDQLEWMRDQGWEVKVLTYPQLLKDKLGYAILEFQSEVNVTIKG